MCHLCLSLWCRLCRIVRKQQSRTRGPSVGPDIGDPRPSQVDLGRSPKTSKPRPKPNERRLKPSKEKEVKGKLERKPNPAARILRLLALYQSLHANTDLCELGRLHVIGSGIAPGALGRPGQVSHVQIAYKCTACLTGYLRGLTVHACMFLHMSLA